MENFNLEKPDYVFFCVPEIRDVCIEYDIDQTDAKTITAMYEVFKRMNGGMRVIWDEDAYNEGYKEGWNDAIEKAEDKVDDLSWEIGRLKKK